MGRVPLRKFFVTILSHQGEGGGGATSFVELAQGETSREFALVGVDEREGEWGLESGVADESDGDERIKFAGKLGPMNVVALEAVVAAAVSGDVWVKALASANVSRLVAGAAVVAAAVVALEKLRIVWRGEILGEGVEMELDLLFSLFPFFPLPFFLPAVAREEVSPVTVSTLGRLAFPLISVPAASMDGLFPSPKVGEIVFPASVTGLAFLVCFVFSSLDRPSSSGEDPSSSEGRKSCCHCGEETFPL